MLGLTFDQSDIFKAGCCAFLVHIRAYSRRLYLTQRGFQLAFVCLMNFRMRLVAMPSVIVAESEAVQPSSQL